MLEVELFVGFPVDPLFAKELSTADPHVLNAFVQEKGEYLQEYTCDGLRYLGKHVGKNINQSELDLVETNIYSLLKKVVPEFPYDETPLYLFAVECGRIENDK